MNRVFPGVGNASACVVRERIYVTGGHYGHRGSCTYEQIQVYTADANAWSIITVNPHPGTAGEGGTVEGQWRRGLSAQSPKSPGPRCSTPIHL